MDYVDHRIPLHTETDFVMHFRLRKERIYDLVNYFRISESFSSLNYNREEPPLNPENHILIFLWFAGHKCSYRDVADCFNKL